MLKVYRGKELALFYKYPNIKKWDVKLPDFPKQVHNLEPLLISKRSKVNNLAEQPKILVVDDEPNIVLAVEFLLQREGWNVQKAYNGVEALEQLASFHPDVILLDVMMPGMDGFELASQIRQRPRLEEVKIIFLTAKGTQRDKETGYAKGAEYYMVKPFDNDVLVQTIQEILVYG